MRRLAGFAVAAGAWVIAQTAAAHTPYLAPTTFGPERDYVTVQAAMTEGNYFVPDFAIRGAGDYLVIGPSGTTTPVAPAATLKEMALIEAPLPEQGTYRITTGERLGRAGKWAKVDGVWRAVRPAGAPVAASAMATEGPISESQVPAGAEIQATQAFLKAETYVTRGAPSNAALKTTGQGFEVLPETHPNAIYAKEPFRFQFLIDGKPAAGQPFHVARAGDTYAETRFSLPGKTGPDGRAAITLAEPGVYVLEVNYPERAEGAPRPIPRSVAYSLTFEVTR
jgi:hypothetical protein